jgi:3-oxoacyl-(acyl-carrier-protein) synthase
MRTPLAKVALLALLVLTPGPATAQVDGGPIDIQLFRPAMDSKGYITLNASQERVVNAAISNTFGFGGHYASVVIKKYQP